MKGKQPCDAVVTEGGRLERCGLPARYFVIDRQRDDIMPEGALCRAHVLRLFGEAAGPAPGPRPNA